MFCLFSLQINLRLILVSGKTKEFLFSPSDSAGDIAQTVFDQWPEGNIIIFTNGFHIRKKNKDSWTRSSSIFDQNTKKHRFLFWMRTLIHSLYKNLDWTAEAVPKAEVLRLIYQGRFLHCNVTLGALSLPLGKTTVMHLVPRDNLPEPNSQGNSTLKTIKFLQTTTRKAIYLKQRSVNKKITKSLEQRKQLASFQVKHKFIRNDNWQYTLFSHHT